MAPVQGKLGQSAKGSVRGVGTAQRPAFLPTRCGLTLHQESPCMLFFEEAAHRACTSGRRNKLFFGEGESSAPNMEDLND